MHPSRTRRPLEIALCALLLLLSGAASAGAQVDTGTANFSRYVAIGDSLTAGFMSGGLVREVQANSYPALIWRQVHGTATGFEQPLVSAPGIPPLLALRGLFPTVLTPKSNAPGQPVNLNLPRPYNNLGVPGADAQDVVATVTGGLHDLVLRGQGTQLQQALALQPTFATVWVGNNDVLGAATSGRVIDDVTLTSAPRFELYFRDILMRLNAAGAKMAVGNIPDVTAIPFVTTIPRFVVDPRNNQLVLVGGNPVPLVGVGPGDFVLLSAASLLGQGIGIPLALGGRGTPLPDEVVLSAAEVATIRARTAALNGIIQTYANQFGAAVMDIHSEFNEVAQRGVTIGGVTYTTAFLTGGFFSYDGVHPTPFGYAYVANLFIEAINEQFDGEIPPVNLFPFMFGPEASAGFAPSTAQLSPLAVEMLLWSLDVPKPAPPAAGKRGRGRGKGGRR
ncbi:MAG TPA: SGNH/GDSL hydrolase family protein [Thermoanaerobaculia bacterium]|nr:SGNH/GDSL hydrolase family protein [Thermoanaerobaculia bacterium]